MTAKLFETLMKQEILYVEEIDRLNACPESLTFFGDEELNGWLYLAGEPGSADWNLARMIGEQPRAFPFIGQLKRKDLHLLVTRENLEDFPQWIHAGSILWFASGSDVSPVTIPTQIEGCEFRQRFNGRAGRHFPTVGPEIYAFSSGQIVGLVKTVRETIKFVEVYIEVEVSRRGQGLGLALLRQMIELVNQSNKTLTYALNDDNQASLALAKRAGLQPFNRLFRLLPPEG
ncbi:MAG: GNAT family N-acetyltransferase [Candidatus Rifleibacteriota bacterium]